MSFFEKILIMNYYDGSVLDDIIFCGYLKYIVKNACQCKRSNLTILYPVMNGKYAENLG